MKKKALIICAAGMSSSLIAKKVTEFFEGKNLPIELDATTVSLASGIIDRDEFDLYLLSPQAKMNYDKLKAQTDSKGKKLENIPPTSYVPTETGITSLAKQVFIEFRDELKASK